MICKMGNTDLRKKNNGEMMDIIYDTLMKNTQHRQLDLEKVIISEVDRNQGTIEFQYGKHTYNLTIS